MLPLEAAERSGPGGRLVLTMPTIRRKRKIASALSAAPTPEAKPKATKPKEAKRTAGHVEEKAARRMDPAAGRKSVKALSSVKGASADISAESQPAADVEDPYFSRAVGKSFLLLNLLSLTEEPATLNQMASRAGLTKSSCFRLLHTLERLHLVKQSSDARYALTESSGSTSSTQITNALLRAPQEPMRSLNEEFGETVSVAVLFTNHIEVVHTLESRRMLRMANTVGRILPPHGSSLGKAITAFQPEDICRKLLVSYGLQRITPHTITDEVLLREEFERIRKQGYAFESEESTPDGCCFCAPIFLNKDAQPGAPVAAISISMPKSRVPEEVARERMIARLLATAREIGRYLHQQIERR